jgi:hypothetical protein
LKSDIDKDEYKSNIKNIKIDEKISKLSKEKINDFVEKLLNNKNINMSYIPDRIEKEMYKNIITMLFAILIDVSNTTKIKIIGHEITITIKPEMNKEKE